MSQATNVIDFNSARKPEGPLIADIDNGYCKVANDIQERVYQLDVSGACHQLLQAIIRHTYGFNKSSDRFTNTFLQELTGLGETAVKVGLKTLIDRKVILAKPAGKMKILSVNRLVSDWQLKAQNRLISDANAPDDTRRKTASYQAQTRPQSGANAPDNRRKSAYTKDNNKNNLQKTNNNVVSQVFLYWQKTMQKPQAKLTSDRRNKITARLKDGYTAEQLMAAIDGCANSDFHMGRQPGKPTQYNDIELICRTGSKVEQFAAIKAQPVQDNDDWVARMMADTEVVV